MKRSTEKQPTRKSAEPRSRDRSTISERESSDTRSRKRNTKKDEPENHTRLAEGKKGHVTY
jgi:hypothetical protein